MNDKYSAAGTTAADKLTLPNLTKREANEMDSNKSQEDDLRKAKAFKFGQVDQKLLMSRLYSTPFNKPTSNQQFVLDMASTSIHKPRIKRLENPLPQAEPVVRLKHLTILFFNRQF